MTTAHDLQVERTAEILEALTRYAAAGKLLELAMAQAEKAADLIKSNLPEHGTEDEVMSAAISLLELPQWIDWEIHTHAYDLDVIAEVVMPWEVTAAIKDEIDKLED